MQWYYAKNNTQFGPVEQGELVARIAAGDIAATDLVWREGLPDWVPVVLVEELRGVVGPAASGEGHPPPPGVAPVAPVFPYAPPTADSTPPYGAAVASNGKATASLVLGIISTAFAVCNFCCFGSMLIAIPCGILAIVFGNQVKQEALTNPSLTAELGKVNAGIITGWVGIGLGVLATVGLALAFLSG